MTRFTLNGRFHGRPASVTWRDGALSGDPDLVERARLKAQNLDGQPIRAGLGPTASHNYLAEPDSAYALLQLVFDGPVEAGEPVPGLAWDEVSVDHATAAQRGLTLLDADLNSRKLSGHRRGYGTGANDQGRKSNGQWAAGNHHDNIADSAEHAAAAEEHIARAQEHHRAGVMANTQAERVAHEELAKEHLVAAHNHRQMEDLTRNGANSGFIQDRVAERLHEREQHLQGMEQRMLDQGAYTSERADRYERAVKVPIEAKDITWQATHSPMGRRGVDYHAYITNPHLVVDTRNGGRAIENPNPTGGNFLYEVRIAERPYTGADGLEHTRYTLYTANFRYSRMFGKDVLGSTKSEVFNSVDEARTAAMKFMRSRYKRLVQPEELGRKPKAARPPRPKVTKPAPEEPKVEEPKAPPRRKAPTKHVEQPADPANWKPGDVQHAPTVAVIKRHVAYFRQEQGAYTEAQRAEAVQRIGSMVRDRVNRDLGDTYRTYVNRQAIIDKAAAEFAATEKRLKTIGGKQVQYHLMPEERKAQLQAASAKFDQIATRAAASEKAYDEGLKTHTLKVLHQLRDFGGTPLNIEAGTAISRRRDASGWRQQVMGVPAFAKQLAEITRGNAQYLPTDWIEASNAHSLLETGIPRPGEKLAGGYTFVHSYGGSHNAPTGRIIARQTVNGHKLSREEQATINIHELGHRVEDVVPHVVELEHSLYTRRTAGEQAVMGKTYGKIVKRDQWPDEYMGRAYKGAPVPAGPDHRGLMHNYELITRGLEYLHSHSAMARVDSFVKDPEFHSFTLGILAAV